MMVSNFNLRQLEVFVMLADELHFSRAAERLEISQPSLSQQIKRLEHNLGIKLIDRTRQPIELTAHGRLFLPRARAILRQASIAGLEMHDLNEIRRGHLRVGAAGTLATFMLPEIVARYRARYPSIVIEITQQNSDRLAKLVENGKVDVALCRLPFDRDNVEIMHLSTEPFHVVIPPDHPQAGLPETSLAAFANDDFVMPVVRDTPFFRLAVDMCRQAGFTPNIILAGAEYTTAFRLIGLGLGVSIVSELATNLVVDPSPAFSRIVEPHVQSEVVLAYLGKETLSPAAKAFVELSEIHGG